MDIITTGNLKVGSFLSFFWQIYSVSICNLPPSSGSPFSSSIPSISSIFHSHCPWLSHCCCHKEIANLLLVELGKIFFHLMALILNSTMDQNAYILLAGKGATDNLKKKKSRTSRKPTGGCWPFGEGGPVDPYQYCIVQESIDEMAGTLHAQGFSREEFDLLTREIPE